MRVMRKTTRNMRKAVRNPRMKMESSEKGEESRKPKQFLGKKHAAIPAARKIARKIPAFELLTVSAFAALAVLFLLAWLASFGFRPSVSLIFYLAPLGVFLAIAEELVFREVVQKAVGTAPQIVFYMVYAGFVAAWLLPEGQFHFVASAFPVAFLATALALRFGCIGALWFRIFFLSFSMIALVSVALAFSLLLLLTPFALVQIKRKTVGETIAALSLKWTGLKDTLSEGAKLFAAIFAVLFVEGLALSALGVLDAKNVAAVIKKQSLLGIALAVTLAPVGEEIFFRGYLQKRIGIFLASVLFAWLHLGYGSTVEIIAAFTVSVILGLWLRKNDNVFPCILAHAFYNVFSVVAILAFAQT